MNFKNKWHKRCFWLQIIVKETNSTKLNFKLHYLKTQLKDLMRIDKKIINAIN